MTHPQQPDPRLAALIQAHRLSRRGFLGKGLVVAGGMVFAPALLGACGDDDESSESSDSTGPTSGDNLRISNWPLYMADGFNTSFEEETGISVDYQENFQDNETWFAANKDALAAEQDIGTDLVIPTDFLTGRLVSLGWLLELNRDNIPNITNLRPELEELAADPGNVHSLPYMTGLLGLAYNKAETGREITSVDDLWDPAFKGRVTLLSDVRDGLGMIMLSQGNSPTEATAETVQQAADLVAEENAKGQIRRFTGNDYQDDLTSGNVIIAQVYSGDLAQLKEENPDLEFVVPEGGSTQFVDTMVIPYTTRNQAGAEAWMNFVYDKANYAKLIEAIQYVPVLADMTAELEAIDPALAANPLVNPPQETLDLISDWRPLTDEEDQEYASIYTEITGG
jgi:spermidine/putrescine transport system substrate-binding protein